MTDEEIKKLIAEQVKAATEETVQKSIADGLKSILPGIMAEGLKTAVAPLQADLEKLKAGGQQQAQGNGQQQQQGQGQGQNQGNGQQQQAVDPRVDQLLREQDEMKKKLTAKEQELAADRLDAALREALGGVGIRPASIPKALVWLKTTGVLAEKDGVHGFKGKDRWGNETVLPLADGLKAWAATDDAKDFLPPTPGGGTGDKVGPSDAPKTKDGATDWGALRNAIPAVSLINDLQN